MYEVIDYVSGKPYGDRVSSLALARTAAYRAVQETGQPHQIRFIESRVIETVSRSSLEAKAQEGPRLRFQYQVDAVNVSISPEQRQGHGRTKD